MLKWDDKYELGNEKIDAEHRIFLGLIVDFHDAAMRGESTDKLIRIFKEISKYAEFHFLSEENVMTEYNYPEQPQHAQMHSRLLSEAKDKLYQLIRGSISPDEVFEFLFEWFAFHTSTEDKKLVGFIGNGMKNES
jgi:hemerythrin